MYLKSLEIVGFKSFADKTRLVFEPGMTAIVGPNGCGKSNVSDAIRWVLGEQSAKALRGHKMEDCIFNGTQDRKPLGMAEVSITFTDCENTLDTEYHEVTITRRVFRSGESQYFVNKAPCRLKDIQRMFMDTGIGTSSYSFMAQGRLDQILSARPEDRRAIFEEASGITKYKSDKKEALRKLEHTEANLLRLTDVIREVKRQIGSLQRQAGKARRYKTFRDEMRSLDLYASRQRLIDFNTTIKKLDSELQELTGQISAAHHEVERQEAANVALREDIMATERQISSAMEASVQVQSRLERTQDMIRINSQRIEEYKNLSERDTRELDTLQEQERESRALLERLNQQAEEAQAARDKARAELDAFSTAFEEHRRRIDEIRRQIQNLRNEAVKLESQGTKVHNQLVQIESQERSTVIQRERLAAEKAQLQDIAAGFREQLEEIERNLQELRATVEAADNECRTLDDQRNANREAAREMQQQRSAKEAEKARRQTAVELLSDADEVQGDFPGGTQLLLDSDNPLEVDHGKLLGALAEHITAPQEYTRALEAALRSMLDAIVVEDNAVLRDILRKVRDAGKGAARLAVRNVAAAELPELPAGMRRLIDVVQPSSDDFQGLLQQLLGHVALAESLEDIPEKIPAGLTVVTPDGVLIRADGSAEFWMNEPGVTNPLGRKHAIAAAQQDIERIEGEIADCDATLQKLRDEAAALEKQAADARRRRDEARQKLAQKQGEFQMVTREAKTAGKRLETVSWELKELENKGSSRAEEKQQLAQRQAEIKEDRERVSTDIASQTKELQELEEKHNALQTELMEKRIAFESSDNRVNNIKGQTASVVNRLKEIEASLHGRAEGLKSYADNISQLKKAVEDAKGQLAGLEKAVDENRAKTGELKKAREAKSGQLKEQEAALTKAREDLEKLMLRKSEIDVSLAEANMRRQNLTDRITAEYNLTIEQVMDEPEPDWDDEPMAVTDAETRVAELRTKLDAMGPVNLVAIEEYQEHEERYTFLTQQEADLVKAKDQLLEMIKKINQTTSELFRKTFDQANENFQKMFTRLFNGGSAKLVLVNEEDVLDCGIEIIARPPGKRLQNISLLSGGERTLTAVALLFSIYQIKPSPFCMLDELDAPLDDTNIGRFCEILKEFLEQSQFVVITHNRQTIAAAGIIYGVTMPERGVSRIMSMKFKDEKGQTLTNEQIGA